MDEDPEEAAIRETLEETGYEVELLGDRFPRSDDYIRPLALQKNMVKEDHIHMDFIYAAKIVGGSEILNEKETDGINWFTVDEIKSSSFETFPDTKKWVEIIKDKYM